MKASDFVKKKGKDKGNKKTKKGSLMDWIADRRGKRSVKKDDGDDEE